MNPNLMRELIMGLPVYLIYIIPGYALMELIAVFTKPRGKTLFKMITCMALGLIANTIIFVDDITNVIYALISFFLVMCICFKGPILPRISVVILFYPLIVATQVICTNGLKLVNMLQLFITIAFWLLICWLFKGRLTNAKESLDTKTYLLLDAICATTFIINIALVIELSSNDIPLAVLAASLTIVTHIGILTLLITIIEHMKNQTDLKQLQMQKTYYTLLDEEQLRTSKIRHDMNNHMQVIDGLIKESQYDQAGEYIESLFTTLNNSVMKNYTGNPVINLVLNQKIQKTKEAHIVCEPQIELKDIKTISDMDLCSLFSNTLDNAIEACEKIEDKSKCFISVKALNKNNCFSYSISNSKVNTIRRLNGKFITDKKDPKLHGYGVANVKTLVEKYNGEIELEDKDHMFSITIIIPLRAA